MQHVPALACQAQDGAALVVLVGGSLDQIFAL